ncbi:MAG: SprB repeat-containing protein, partial [Bacteroidota bacterium]|nr:SprB repeat-containing protein [Bacteroidota bacterium]
NKYWTGGNGSWNDASNWSATATGPGGAGIPLNGENVFIIPEVNSAITIAEVAWCNDLFIDASTAQIMLNGEAELNIEGAWSMKGAVLWDHTGVKNLIVRQRGVYLDTRGIPIKGDVVFEGSGSWSLQSDLFLSEGSDIMLMRGTLIGNANLLKADRFEFAGTGTKQFIAGDGVVMLDEKPSQLKLDLFVQPANSTLVIDGSMASWDIPATHAERDRDMNVCGTGAGQTPFIINAQLVSNFNGYGVRCRGICNGSVTVSVSGGVGPFAYQWLNSGPPTATWNSACGGPQIVIVTDLGQGISCPASVNVTEPAPLGVIFFGQGTPPTCADVCNGTRTALAVGGVPPHAYSWNNGAGSSSSFSQLCAGQNTLLITDANNCTFDTSFFFNIQPIIPDLSITDASCYDECDGTATVSPSGGTGTLTISWTPAPPIGQGTTQASGFCAGNYSVSIADGNGCDTTLTFIIAEPLPISGSVVSTDATCSGACDGTANLTMTTGGPFSFAWDPAPGSGQGSTGVMGLCAGTYTVLVTDQTSGCDTLLSVLIDSPEAFDIQPLIVNAGCATSCDGSISLTTTGGTAGYTFLWDPIPTVGQGTASISSLCAGAWEVLFTDAAGCDTVVVFDVDAPLPLDPDLSSTDINCAGDCDGTATASVTGGVPGYTYLWTPAPPIGQGTASAAGLCAGPYQLLISNANGCDTLVTFPINEPPPLVIVPSQQNVSCNGACDGSATVSVSGGVPGYTYTWTPEPASGQGTSTVSGLCPGSWQVLVADANGCEVSTQIQIQDALPLVISLGTIPASCPGECDGTAGLIVSGGTAGYTYSWSPEPGVGQGTANVAGLCPQDWSITITDALGCDSTITFTIDAPEPIVANETITDASCAGQCNASIGVAPTGGTGTYTYNWMPAPAIGQGTSIASGLCPGNWSVTITSGACDTTLIFVITSPTPIVVELAITNVTCPGACDGGVAANTSGGTSPFNYTWAPAPGSGQGTSDVGGLCSGNYSVLILDAAGCDTTLNFAIDEPDEITAVISITEPSCGASCDGSATITVTGGTLPYDHTWGPGNITGQGTITATDLCPGTYEVIVTDGAGCTETFNVVIDPPIGWDVTGTPTEPACSNSCDGSITTSTTGGVPPYNYTWSPVPPVGQGTPNASGLCAGTWSVLIADAAGCDTLLTFDLIAPAPILPNEVFTNESCNGPCDGTATVAPTGGVGPYTFIWSPIPPIGQGTPTVSG